MSISAPTHDTAGRPIDAHDGCLRLYDGVYYLYGTRYGDTDGFTPANRYVVYRSEDLVAWTLVGNLLPDPLPGVSYRPYVGRNRDGRYVCWFNWYPKLWEGQFGVAVSDTPGGPFEVVHERANVARAEPGDHGLFVDDDGSGYLIYTAIPALDPAKEDRHRMAVERLAPDLLSSTGEVSDTIADKVEAPTLFKKDGVYWCVFGGTCCFCPEGADVRLHRAEDPMGPWTRVRELNRDTAGALVVPGQQTDVAHIPLPGGDGTPDHVWMADLWESAKRAGDPVKGHDRQHWEVLRFDDDGVPLPLAGGA